jgi:hypothetical protein
MTHQRPQTLSTQSTSWSGKQTRPHGAHLVSCTFHHTTLPLFYTHILHSQCQSMAVLQSLCTRLHRVPCPYRTLVLPNLSAENADMFWMERVCDVSCQLRPGSSNSESAQAMHAYAPQRSSTSLLNALVEAVIVSSSCVLFSLSFSLSHHAPHRIR